MKKGIAPKPPDPSLHAQLLGMCGSELSTLSKTRRLGFLGLGSSFGIDGRGPWFTRHGHGSEL